MRAILIAIVFLMPLMAMSQRLETPFFYKKEIISHLKSDDQQHNPKNIQKPGKPLDQCACGKNKDEPHDNGPQDAPEQYTFEILWLDIK